METVSKLDPKKDRPPPPPLSIPLIEALNEIGMVSAGYKTTTPVDEMSYFSAAIRMIAMRIHNAQSFRM